MTSAGLPCHRGMIWPGPTMSNSVLGPLASSPSPFSFAEGMDRVRAFGLAAVGGVFVIATVVLGVAGRNSDEIQPPEAVPRGVALGLLFLVPAIVGTVGVRRRSSVVLLGAGIATLAAVPLSVATVALAIPALLFIAAGASAAPPTRGATWLAAAAIVALQIGAIVGLLSTTETRCWVAYQSGGGYVYRTVPTTDAGQTMGGPGQPVAGGCGGELTERGAALAGVLAIGAVAVALATPRPHGFPLKSRPGKP